MIVTDGQESYEWIENWARTPDTPASRENGRTHGVAESSDGSVYVFHQSTPAVLVFDQEGALVRSFGDNFAGAHGLTLVNENGREFLWLTDEANGRVEKLTLGGESVQAIRQPKHVEYNDSRYSPTWVAVNPTNGDIWVADGYGSSLVHRYDSSGDYIHSIDGNEPGAAGRFACPHAVFFDTRGGKTPELYVADRGNRRVQVYDGEGNFKRSFGEDIFVHPCAFAVYGEALYVPELFGRMAVLDANDKLIGYVGQNDRIAEAPGWPGLSVKDWPNLPPDQIQAGKFSSPHGVGTGPDGSVYVVEWIIGGRIIRLNPV